VRGKFDFFSTKPFYYNTSLSSPPCHRVNSEVSRGFRAAAPTSVLATRSQARTPPRCPPQRNAQPGRAATPRRSKGAHRHVPSVGLRTPRPATLRSSLRRTNETERRRQGGERQPFRSPSASENTRDGGASLSRGGRERRGRAGQLNSDAAWGRPDQPPSPASAGPSSARRRKHRAAGGVLSGAAPGWGRGCAVLSLFVFAYVLISLFCSPPQQLARKKGTWLSLPLSLVICLQPANCQNE